MNVFKTLLKKACEAAVSVSILLCCGIISVSAQSDFKAYIPDTENAGIVSGWEGKTLPLTDTYKPGDYLQRVIKFKDGSWWGLQLKRENNADVSNWGSPGYKYDDNRHTVEVLLPDSAAQWPNFYYHPAKPIKASDVKYIVIGLYSSRDMDLCMFPTYEAADEYASGAENRLVALNVKKGYHEYFINVEDTNRSLNWINSDMPEYDYFRFYDMAGQKEKPATLIFSYIRFVNDEYKGTLQGTEISGIQVKDGIIGYDTENNILDFVFSYELDSESVSWSTITLNGSPVKNIITDNTKSDRFRVDLGNLDHNTEYTVHFKNLKSADGMAVDETFTFTTVQTQRKNIEAYIPYSEHDGVKNSWSGKYSPINTPDFSEYSNRCIYFEDGSWWGWKTEKDGDVSVWASAMYQYDSETETVGINLPEDADHWPHFYYRPSDTVKSWETAYIVAGIYASRDMEIYMYPVNRKSDENVQGSADNVVVFKLKSGYHEYIISLNDKSCVNGWYNGGEYDYFHFYDIDGTAERGSEVRFSYLCFAGDDYKGFLNQTDYRGRFVADGIRNYDCENTVIDFVFLDDLDMNTVTQQSVTVNGKNAAWVMQDTASENRIRVNLGKLSDNTKYTVRFSGISNADGNSVNEEFVFSTGDAEQVKLRLLKNYGTDRCEEITENTDISGQTVSAVCSGLGSQDEKICSIIIALYKDGILQSVKKEDISPLNRDTSSEYSVSVNVPKDDGKYEVSAFCWENVLQKPICEAVKR